MLRFAISGMGDHALRAHLMHLVDANHFPDCTIAGVFDPELEPLKDPVLKAEQALTTAREDNKAIRPELLPLPRYASFAELIADKPDGVFITGPDRFHLPQLQQAVAAGIHVFCEKPMCTDAAEIPALKAVLHEAQQKNVVVTSCHPRRFDPPYVYVQQNLGYFTALLGPLCDLTLDFSYHVADQAKEGLHAKSLLQDHANHEIDYAHWLIGMAPTTAFKLIDSVERYALTARRDDGVILNFRGTRALDTSIYTESLHLRFARGELFIDTYAPENSRLRQHEHLRLAPERLIRPLASTTPVHQPTNYDKRFRAVNRAFADAILGKTPNYLNAEALVANSLFSVGLHQADKLDFHPQQTRLTP